MKLKKFSLICLATGLLMTAAGALTPFLLYKYSDSPDIIGGASLPSYDYVLHRYNGGFLYALIILGITLVITAVFSLIFSGTLRAHCSIITTCISLAISAVSAAGTLCFFLWLIIVLFYSVRVYPIEYPLSIALGLLCFLTFVVLCIFYFKVRKKKRSRKGVLIDILTAVGYSPAFFFTFMYLYNILQ